MKFTGMLRRVVGAGAALVAVGAMLMAPASATAAPQDGVATAGLVKILHASTRACLDSDAAQKVYTLGCPGENPISDNQKWSNSAGKYKNVKTGWCLAASPGGSLYTTPNCDADVVLWATSGESPTKITHQKFRQCLHGSGGSPQGVELIACGSATRWSILPTS